MLVTVRIIARGSQRGAHHRTRLAMPRARLRRTSGRAGLVDLACQHSARAPRQQDGPLPANQTACPLSSAHLLVRLRLPFAVWRAWRGRPRAALLFRGAYLRVPLAPHEARLAMAH